METNRTVLYYNEIDRKAIWCTESHLFVSTNERQFSVMSATNIMINDMDKSDKELVKELVEAVRYTCKLEGSKI